MLAVLLDDPSLVHLCQERLAEFNAGTVLWAEDQPVRKLSADTEWICN